MAKVIVVGAGKIGSHLAEVLIEGGHEVRVVEPDTRRAADLERSIANLSVVTGSGTDATVLERAGVRDCTVLAAVTGADETNLVACTLARFEFSVPRVIARIVDPAKAWMYGEDMGVDVALNQADILARLVAEEMSLGEMTILLKLRRGQFELVEEIVAPESRTVGQAIQDVAWPGRCRVVAVIREGELFSPEPDLVIEPGDELLAVTHTGSAAALAHLLGKDQR